MLKWGLVECLGYGQGSKGLVGKRQLIHSMGLVWRDSSHPCTKSYLPKRRPFHFCFNRHTCANNSLNMLKICFLFYSYFSPLQVKNKPCDGGTKHEFILEPVSLVVDRYY